MKTITLLTVAVLILTANLVCAAETRSLESWSVDGKTFQSKALAIRYIVSTGKQVEVIHSRCEILTNKFSFKACPKNKELNFETKQFESLSQSK